MLILFAINSEYMHVVIAVKESWLAGPWSNLSKLIKQYSFQSLDLGNMRRFMFLQGGKLCIFVQHQVIWTLKSNLNPRACMFVLYCTGLILSISGNWTKYWVILYVRIKYANCANHKRRAQTQERFLLFFQVYEPWL